MRNLESNKTGFFTKHALSLASLMACALAALAMAFMLWTIGSLTVCFPLGPMPFLDAVKCLWGAA